MTIELTNRINGDDDSRQIARGWLNDSRWKRVTRPYRPEDVLRLRGARSQVNDGRDRSAQKLWSMLHDGPVLTWPTDDLQALRVCVAEQSQSVGETFLNARQTAEAGLAALLLDTHPDVFAQQNSHTSARCVEHLVAARLAADVESEPLVLMARVHAKDDAPAVTGYACAPYADLIWYETDVFDLQAAQNFAADILRLYPQHLLAYYCTDEQSRVNVAHHRQQLLDSGFSIIRSQPTDDVFVFTQPTRSSPELSEDTLMLNRIAAIVTGGLERGASMDLTDVDCNDETQLADLN